MKSSYTRRDFAKLALAALPVAGLLSATRAPAADAPAAPAAKPNSKVRGVQLGLNVPYSFSNPLMSGDQVLRNCVQLGLSAVELRAQPVEQFLGVPVQLIAPAVRGVRVDPAVVKKNVEALREWRAGVAMSRVQEFRRTYEEAGVLIEILKIDNITRLADSELDYCFTMGKALGAYALSCEVPAKDEDLKRIGGFADKHQLMIGYHGHTKATAATWENAFTFAAHNGANVDLGHFVAGNNASPVELIKKHHARITHVHLKDKKMNEGENTPFGEGDTPIVEVLRLIRDNGWRMQATIEFEYRVPAGSDRMTEIARTVKYCRDALA